MNVTSIPSEPVTVAVTGPVLFAYDGSDLAETAIVQAAKELAVPRDAIVVCVWQPADVGFTPTTERHFDANQATAVHEAAEETAAHGAMLAEKAGFRARSVAVQAAPTWKGIVATSHQEGASLIVMGSHRHAGLVGHLVGSVASAVIAHSETSVMVVHQR